MKKVSTKNPSSREHKDPALINTHKCLDIERDREDTWLNLVWRVELTSSKARRRVANSLRASSVTISLAMPSQSIVLDALKATSTIFFPVPLIFLSFPPEYLSLSQPPNDMLTVKAKRLCISISWALGSDLGGRTLNPSPNNQITRGPNG